MRGLRRFGLRSIRGQIIALAILPILLVLAVAIADRVVGPDEEHRDRHPDVLALRVETVVRLVQAAEGPAQAAAILETVQRSGLRVELVPASALTDGQDGRWSSSAFSRLTHPDLPSSFDMVLRKEGEAEEAGKLLLVRLDGERALAFHVYPAAMLPKAIAEPLKYASVVGLVLVVLLSIYAVRVITAPLSRFAAAAAALRPDEGPDRPFEERGAREIAALARALNDMRSRIRGMLDDRTRMLRAVSHDLRTPLTRLRLRAERATEPALRTAMLQDIERIGEMIEETLTYLREDVWSEQPLKADLPSLLQTVCHDFADVGFAVRYEGPDRLAWLCRPRALERAVANLVDNGTKYGREVVVRLSRTAEGALQIEVADDGPGLPAELRARVTEPFFKADPARGSDGRSGFGLGLSIVRDVVRGHGGTLAMLDNRPQGLVVRLLLPADGPAAAETSRPERAAAVAAVARPHIS